MQHWLSECPWNNMRIRPKLSCILATEFCAAVFTVCSRLHKLFCLFWWLVFTAHKLFRNIHSRRDSEERGECPSRRTSQRGSDPSRKRRQRGSDQQWAPLPRKQRQAAAGHMRSVRFSSYGFFQNFTESYDFKKIYKQWIPLTNLIQIIWKLLGQCRALALFFAINQCTHLNPAKHPPLFLQETKLKLEIDATICTWIKSG